MELLRRQKDLAGGLGVLKRYFLTAQVPKHASLSEGLMPCSCRLGCP